MTSFEKLMEDEGVSEAGGLSMLGRIVPVAEKGMGSFDGDVSVNVGARDDADTASKAGWASGPPQAARMTITMKKRGYGFISNDLMKVFICSDCGDFMMKLMHGFLQGIRHENSGMPEEGKV